MENKNIYIETERLIIKPLDVDNFNLWINDLDKFEKNNKLKYEAEKIENIFKEILLYQLDKCKNDIENYIWHTFWIIILKESNTIIGSIDFKDVPKNGIVEIGYGLGENFLHHGYMTESVKAFYEFAFTNKEVVKVIAETEKWNLPSQNILIRNGFKKYLEGETYWFEKNK